MKTPPGRSTRRASATRRSGKRRCSSSSPATAASNVASSNGRGSSRSAQTVSIPSLAASSRASRSTSTPTTSFPSTYAAVSAPYRQPRSSTRLPVPSHSLNSSERSGSQKTKSSLRLLLWWRRYDSSIRSSSLMQHVRARRASGTRSWRLAIAVSLPRKVAIEELRVLAGEHVPVARTPCRARRFRQPPALGLVTREPLDRLDELTWALNEHAGACLAQVARYLVVVGHGRDSHAHVLGHLDGADALVGRARIEREIEVRGVREHLVARHAPEQEDVGAARAASPDPIARTSEQPEPGGGHTGADLVPELEEMVDVVE